MKKEKRLENALRPYDKCKKYGVAGLSDSELLAVILRTGSRNESVEELSERLLYGTLNGVKLNGLNSLYGLSFEELKSHEGIGDVKAYQLMCICELSRRISKQKIAVDRMDFSNPEKIAAYYMEDMRHLTKEKVLLLMLDSKSQLIRDEIIGMGTVNSCCISVREIFIEALKCQAVSLILIHNHPSGDPSPSTEDYQITEKLIMASKFTDLKLLDHIIIGRKTWFSFQEHQFL